MSAKAKAKSTGFFIRVRPQEGDSFVLDVDANDTIDNVKDAIQEATCNENLPDGIPAVMQRLSNAGGKQLDEGGRTLADYKVTGRWILKVSWCDLAMEDYMGLVDQEDGVL